MRARSERQPRESNRSAGWLKIELVMLIVVVGAFLAVACGETLGQRKNSPTPAGGITATMPFQAPDRDPSSPSEGADSHTVLAPIESVEIERLAAKLPNATLIVVSGLPSDCEPFGGYSIDREGDAIIVEVTNIRRDLNCATIYKSVTTSIPLERSVYRDIEPCATYTVVVNDESHSVQASCPPIDPMASEEASTPVVTPGAGAKRSPSQTACAFRPVRLACPRATAGPSSAQFW